MREWYVQDFVDAIKVYDRHAEFLELNMTPKRHGVMHLAHQMSFFGAVAASGTWTDERYNGHLRPIVQTAHRRRWHARILSEARRGLPATARSRADA